MTTVATKTRALCIVNPSAGMRHAKADDLASVLEILGNAGFETEVAECALPHPSADELAQQAIEAGREAVIAGGGDGTVQAVGRALIGTDVVLGILPFGRSMNIARGLRIPLDAVEAARVIASEHVRRMDVGEVHGQVFFETAGIGVDAEAFGAARAAERGRWRGAVRRVGRFLRQRSYRFRVRTSKGDRRIRAHQALVLNSPFYAWSFPIAPDADMHDGLLDVAIFPRKGQLRLAWTLVRTALGGELPERPVLMRDREIEIDASEPLSVHADGRIVGKLPATFTCRARALAVYVPER